MKKNLVVYLVSILTLSITCTSCKKTPQPTSEVAPTEAQGLLRNDFAVLVDAREENEIQNGLAQPAQWLAFSHIQKKDADYQKFIGKISKDKQVIVYCSNASCARDAAQLFSSEGFKASILGTTGDYDTWLRSGLPTKKP